MSMEKPDEVVVTSGTPGWVAPAMVVLLIISIAGLGFAWHDSNQIEAAQEGISGEMKTAAQSNAQQIAALQQKESQLEATNSELQSDLGVVTKRLRVTQSDLKTARDEASQIRDEESQKLAQMDTDVKNQLATKANADDLNTTNTNVAGVRTDLDGTKNDLKMAHDQLGNLIAHNHDEIDELRHMGDRDYVEFTVDAKNKPQKVGNVTVTLRSANAKKNQFSVRLLVNDVTTDNDNRAVNEPIIFYPTGTHQAEEIVINQVGKNKITGYLSMPKNQGAATSASLSGN